MSQQLKLAFLKATPNLKDAEWIAIESETVELQMKRKELLFEEVKERNFIH